jgi:hypothetical protein
MSGSRRRRTQIAGQFAPRTIEMLRSPAWRVLSLSARRVLDRLEIELADHGGVDNGKLPVTYEDFVRYGIERHAIAPALREVVALGFVEITQLGRAGNAEFRRPALYRLTYRNTKFAPTDEWKKIGEDQAPGIARTARAASTSATRHPALSPTCRSSTPMSTTTSASAAKTENQSGKNPSFGAGIPHRKPEIHRGETHTTVHSGETGTTLDISGRGSDDNDATEADLLSVRSRSAPRGAVASEHGRGPTQKFEGTSKLTASPQLSELVRARGWLADVSGGPRT